jgi:hypothetical protein
MNADEAWEIYDSQAGKAGRPSAEFGKAKLFLIEKKLLGEDADTGKEKKDKKPPLELEIIKDPYNVPHIQQLSIYMEGLKYISDKRNFDFDYYLIGRYGLTSKICSAWENLSHELQGLRTLASELMEHKLLDAINDKWSGGNPLGNMLTLKAVYGYTDRGDGGTLMVDGNIEILSDVTEDDMEDMNYGGDDSEELEYDNEEAVK